MSPFHSPWLQRSLSPVRPHSYSGARGFAQRLSRLVQSQEHAAAPAPQLQMPELVCMAAPLREASLAA